MRVTSTPAAGVVSERALRYAARCSYLRTTMGSTPGGNLVNICRHIVRDGMSCVGPFLDETETTCGLWEPSQRDRLVARDR